MIYVMSVLKKNSEFSVNKCQNSMAKKPWWFEILPTILKFAIIVKKFAGDNFSNFMELFYFRYFSYEKTLRHLLRWNCHEGNGWKKSTKFNFSSQNLRIECNFFKWDGKVTKIWYLFFHRIRKKWIFIHNFINYRPTFNALLSIIWN